ncbi:MAG: hypothetical protein J6I64_08285 [Lachnospiraceae bacterium]|nr:hypothetical protein [Lachnospiraceae bacterium]
MREWKRRIAGIMAVVMMLAALGGCDKEPLEDGGDSALMLPDQMVSLVERPELVGSPVALAQRDSAPLVTFSVDLIRASWKSARERGAENPVLSPVSVYLAMMVTACSSAQTDAEQLAEWEALFGVPEKEWDTWGTKLMRHLNWSKEDSCVTATNSLWLDEGMSLAEEVLQRISQHLYTDVYQGDLQSEKIMQAINEWVDHKTQGMIPQFLQAPYDEMTFLSILNAVYLEAKWQEAFLPPRIQEKIFYTAQEEEILAEYLTDSLCHRAYLQTENWDGVLLPYRDGNLAFAALRPMAGQSADDLLMTLEGKDWSACCENAVETLMNFSMPKFTVEYRQMLTDSLAQMGLEDVLADGGIGIGQTVKIQVDEDGTKAAAVTAVTAAGMIELPEETPLEIHFDRPFVYAVIDTVSGIPLFVGVLDCPVQ